jgi:hypothetical protein
MGARSIPSWRTVPRCEWISFYQSEICMDGGYCTMSPAAVGDSWCGAGCRVAYFMPAALCSVPLAEDRAIEPTGQNGTEQSNKMI